MNDYTFWLGHEAEQFHHDWPEGMLAAVPCVDLTDEQAFYD